MSESSDAIEHRGSALAWDRKSDRMVALAVPERLLAYCNVESSIPVFCALSCGVTMTLLMEKRAQVRVLSAAGHAIMGETALFLVLLQDTCLDSPKRMDPRSPISLLYPHGARRCFWKAPVGSCPSITSAGEGLRDKSQTQALSGLSMAS